MPTDRRVQGAADSSNVHHLFTPQAQPNQGPDVAERIAQVRFWYHARGCDGTPEVGLACVSIDFRNRWRIETRGLDERTAAAMLDAAAALYWRVHNIAHGRAECAPVRRRRLVPPLPKVAD